MSYAELIDRSDKPELMAIAFTYQKGKSDGNYLMELNPEYQRMVKERQKKLEKAQRVK